MGVIMINIPPEFQRPLTVAWHGLTIALGIILGAVAVARWPREPGLDVEPMYMFGGLAALGGIVGARTSTSSSIIPPGRFPRDAALESWFTFDGGVILAAVLITGYVHGPPLRRVPGCAPRAAVVRRDRPCRRCHQRRAYGELSTLSSRFETPTRTH